MRLAHIKQRWRLSIHSSWTVVDDSLPEIGHSIDEYHAPAGDFLKAYIEHLSLSRWSRWYWQSEWTKVEAIMRQVLNDSNTLTWIDNT